MAGVTKSTKAQGTGDLRDRLEAYYSEALSQPGRITDLHELGGGWETSVYSYQHTREGESQRRVLRLYAKGDSALLRATNEDHVLRVLNRAGYPVPRLFEFQPSQEYLGGPFLIMEYVPGGSLLSMLPENPELVDDFCGLFFQLHQLDWRPLVGGSSPWATPEEAEATLGLPWLTKMIARYGFSAPFDPLLDWIRHRGATIEPRLAIIHGDYHPLNILMSPDRGPVLIDWGSTSIADFRVDVANALLMAGFLGQPHLAPLLQQGYQELAEEEVSGLDYFSTLVLTRRLAILMVAMAHGAGAVGLRADTEDHLRENPHLPLGVLKMIRDQTGVRLTELEETLQRLPSSGQGRAGGPR